MDVVDIDLKLLWNCSEIALKLLWKSAAFRGCLMSVKRREPLPKPGRFQPNLKNLNTTANLLIFLFNYWFKWTNKVTQRSHRGRCRSLRGRLSEWIHCGNASAVRLIDSMTTDLFAAINLSSGRCGDRSRTQRPIHADKRRILHVKR